ncbi:hypothetical protein K8I85_18170 [bacterium]|nr:hypothetical protein [bacterium]
MNRRAFLVAIAAVAATGGGLTLLVTRKPRNAAHAVLGRVRCEDGAELAVHLDDLLPRPAEVRPFGRQVLAAERVRPSRSELAARLFPEDAWAAACQEGVRPVLLDRIRADFVADRIVTVQGWVLSRTEADLYALAELVLSAE